MISKTAWRYGRVPLAISLVVSVVCLSGTRDRKVSDEICMLCGLQLHTVALGAEREEAVRRSVLLESDCSRLLESLATAPCAQDGHHRWNLVSVFPPAKEVEIAHEYDPETLIWVLVPVMPFDQRILGPWPPELSKHLRQLAACDPVCVYALFRRLLRCTDQERLVNTRIWERFEQESRSGRTYSSVDEMLTDLVTATDLADLRSDVLNDLTIWPNTAPRMHQFETPAWRVSRPSPCRPR